MITKDLFEAYKIVRQDFLDHHRHLMSGGLRIARKNIDWFLMVRVERLADKIKEETKAKETLKDTE